MRVELAAAALCLGLVLAASVAHAEASVAVELKRKDGSAVDGVVHLRKGDLTLSCTTQASRCVIGGASGGVYTVDVELSGSPAPKHKTVVIPPTGEVKLIVAVD